MAHHAQAWDGDPSSDRSLPIVPYDDEEITDRGGDGDYDPVQGTSMESVVEWDGWIAIQMDGGKGDEEGEDGEEEERMQVEVVLEVARGKGKGKKEGANEKGKEKEKEEDQPPTKKHCTARSQSAQQSAPSLPTSMSAPMAQQPQGGFLKFRVQLNSTPASAHHAPSLPIAPLSSSLALPFLPTTTPPPSTPLTSPFAFPTPMPLTAPAPVPPSSPTALIPTPLATVPVPLYNTVDMVHAALSPRVGAWRAACTGFHFMATWVLPIPMDDVLDELFERRVAQDIVGAVGMPFRCVLLFPLHRSNFVQMVLTTLLSNTA